MKTIINKTLFLSIMTAFAIGTAMAQPKSNDIIPGSKGDLPTLQDVPEATENILPILHLEMVTGTFYLNNFTSELSLEFPLASTFGGQYYILQYKTNNSWADYASLDGVVHFEGDRAGVTPCSSQFRLKLNGGEKNGWVSNVITVPYVAPLACILTWLDHSWVDFVGAGIPLYNCKAYVTQYDQEGESQEYGEDCEFYAYQWYRRNPNTYEMTLIQGATGEQYTPTIEDVGYEIVKVVTGDNQNLGFYGAHTDGIVKMPIEASIEYLDNNGFVLNTSYVLPNGGKGLCISAEPGNPSSESVPFPEGSIKELKPGQYAVSINKEQYEGYELRYEDDRYRVAFIYDMPDWAGDGQIKPTYREAQLMPDRYMRQLQIKPLLNGVPVSTSVEILGKGIDGKFSTVATLSPEEAENGVFSTEVFGGKYYIKAHATDGTLETYYPDALVWSDAETVEPAAEDWSIDDWQPTTATINIVEAPAPLQGSSVIEGTITVQPNTSNARTRSGGGATYTVFLKDTSTDNIIAQTQTDANGKYRFENVPIGDYIIVPNIDGYLAKAATPLAVKVSKENQTISDVDCTMAELSIEEIFQEDGDYLAGDADGSGEVDAKDITAIVDYLLGKNPENFNKKNADANNDKKVNVADIVEIVNTITNKE